MSNTTQIWVETCHRYGIAALVSQMSFCWETNAGIAKHRLSPQANKALNTNSTNLHLTLNSGKINFCVAMILCFGESSTMNA